jgi:hypothetical protein
VKRLSVLALLAASVLLGGARHARAESIWSYSWSASPGVVTSDDGSGQVTLLPGAGGPITGSVTSGPGILAATLDAVGPASGTAQFSNVGFGLTMHLTDAASNTSGDLTFHGAFFGTLFGTPGLLGDGLAPTYKFPATQSVTLGDNLYSVSLGPYAPPLPGKPGSIGANVVVTGSGQSPPPVNNVPEPASLLLAVFGGSAVGLRAWWRRRVASA